MQCILKLRPFVHLGLTLVAILTVAYQSDAQQFEWAKAFTSADTDKAYGVDVDQQGNVVTVGYSMGYFDLDPSTGVDLHIAPDEDPQMFISKLDANGDYLWGISLGDDSHDYCWTVKTDGQSNIYISGSYGDSIDFDPGPNVALIDSGMSGYSTFIAKYAPNGDFIWVKGFAGTGTTAVGTSLAVDQQDNVYLTGRFNGDMDFDPGASQHVLSGSGNSSAGFVVKLDSDGNFVWASHFVALNDPVNPTSIDVDQNQNVCVVGKYSGTCDFDPGPGVYELTCANYTNAFVLKLGSNGEFLWAHDIGEDNEVNASSTKIDGLGNIYIAGVFASFTDFDFGADSVILDGGSNNGGDAYLLKVNPAGNFISVKEFDYANSWHATEINAIAIDGSDNVHFTGSYDYGTDFSPDSAIFILDGENQTEPQAFFAKLDQDGNLVFAKTLKGGKNYGNAIATDANGNTYAAGSFYGTADFDTGPTDLVFSSITDPGFGNFPTHDAFVMKFSYCEVSTAVISMSDCQSVTVPSGATYNYSGTFMDVIPSSSGCDSLITIQVDILNSSSTQDVVICDTMISPSGNQVWTQNGTYIDHIPNSVGCDSAITFNITVGTSYGTLDTLVCESYTSPSGNYVWNTSGTYQDTISNSVGCDSIITTHLAVATTDTTISVSVCDSFTGPSGNYTWSNSGTYLDTIPNALGCDSVITIDLNVIGTSTASTISVSDCYSYVSPSGNYTWYTDGIYYDTIPNYSGCDSVITIDLSILSSSATLNYTVCDSMTSPSGQYTWYQSGTYLDTINNIANCDSIMTINLTVVDIDTSLSVIGNAVYASPAESYQWLNCNGNVVLMGDTNQVFNIVANGSYAVALETDGCVDTSECYTFEPFTCSATFFLFPDSSTQHNWFIISPTFGTGNFEYLWDWGDGNTDSQFYAMHTYDSAGYYNICLTISDTITGCSDTFCDNSTYIYKTTEMVSVNVVSEIPSGITEPNSDSPIAFYPNPTSGNIQIDFGSLSEQISINAYNLLGKVLRTEVINAGGIIEYEMPQKKGVYLLQLIYSDGKVNYLKVVKE